MVINGSSVKNSNIIVPLYIIKRTFMIDTFMICTGLARGLAQGDGVIRCTGQMRTGPEK